MKLIFFKVYKVCAVFGSNEFVEQKFIKSLEILWLSFWHVFIILLPIFVNCSFIMTL